MATRISARLTPREGRRFGLTVGGAFVALALVTGWRGHASVAYVFGVVGVVLVVAALVAPGRLGPVHAAWMGFAAAISRVTTPVIMGIIYYVILTPTGLLRRLLGKNPIERTASADGFWVVREPEARSRRDMHHQF